MMTWANIKSKALHTLNHATQEADRFAKINQEKRTLQTTQQTMHALFTEIGQSIYQARQDLPNVSPAILDLFTQLESLEKQATDIQQRITELSVPLSPHLKLLRQHSAAIAKHSSTFTLNSAETADNPQIINFSPFNLSPFFPIPAGTAHASGD